MVVVAGGGGSGNGSGRVFKLFCKVADILLKAPDVLMFSLRRKAPHERRRRKHLGGFGGMLPPEIFKIEY